MRVEVADLEANGLLHEADRVWCGVFKDIHTNEMSKYEPWDIDKMLSHLDSVDVLIMHNGIGYDLPLLRKLYGYEFKGKVVDTLLMSRMQDPNRRLPPNCPDTKMGPNSVGAWGYRVGRGKPNHDDWDNYSDAMLHRCTEDVEIQHLIYKALLEEGKGLGWRNAHINSSKLFGILQKQEEYGWLFDKEYAERCIHQLSHWIDRIDRSLLPKLPNVLVIEEAKVKGVPKYVKKPFLKNGKYSASSLTWLDNSGLPVGNPRVIGGPFSRVSFRPVDLNSNAETKAYLLEAGWIPEEWNKNADGVRTSPKLSQGEAFEGVQGRGGRLIVKRVQSRHRRSQIEGWVKSLRDDGRISQVISGIAQTGRLTHKCIVNVPGLESFYGKQMRKCFTSKDGYKIVGTDSAGCQNRMLAARVNDPKFTEILVNGDKDKGTSIHQVNQQAIKAIAGFEVTYRTSKNLNYAFMFGASDKKLGSMINGTEGDGAQIRKALLSISPGFENLVESLTEEWRSNAKKRPNKWGKLDYHGGWIKGLDGRPIFIESEHCILVYMLQSDEAILMQYALVFLQEWLDEKGWTHGEEYGFVANVHDEFQAEVREDLCEEYKKLANRSIAYAGEYLKINCPHVGESDVGDNWSETH